MINEIIDGFQKIFGKSYCRMGTTSSHNAMEQKENRLIASERGLAMFKRNPTDFVARLVTMDETWIHNCTPESVYRVKAVQNVQRPKTRLVRF